MALKRFAQNARKLAQELSGSEDVPKALREKAAALAADLEALAPDAARLFRNGSLWRAARSVK